MDAPGGQRTTASGRNYPIVKKTERLRPKYEWLELTPPLPVSGIRILTSCNASNGFTAILSRV